MPATMGENIKEYNLQCWSLLHLGQSCRRILHILLQTPMVPPVANCLHYHFEEGHLAFPRREATAALPLIS